MKVTLLGTGSPTPMLNRAGSGYLIEIGDEMIVFDHGAGAHERFLRAGKRAVDLHTIFFSHLHADHCLDYARLVHSRWDQGAGQIPELKVYGPSHIVRMTDLLFAEDGVFGPDIAGRLHAPGSQKVFVNRGGTLPRQRPQPDATKLFDGQVIETDNWKLTVREVYHQPGYIEAYGFRLETDEGVLAYSGDTGPCPGIDALAKDADILIHMCFFVSGTFLPATAELTASGHMEIANLAARQNVKTLVATHFTPQMEPPGVRERCVAEMARGYSGGIVWGEDMMELSLDRPTRGHGR
jgi:ribonuclease BN (tRNA processing enzyme)